MSSTTWFRLTAEAQRTSTYGLAHVLPTAGRYAQHPSNPHLQYKAVRVEAEDSPSGKGETMVVTRNLAVREPDGTHSRAVCQVVSHASLTRYVKRSEKVSGRFVLDQEAVRPSGCWRAAGAR